MRIVLSGAPKQGHMWLHCLLGSIYGLGELDGTQTPVMRPDLFRAWVEQGGFPDDHLFHHHARFSHALADAIDAAPARIAVPIRDPYDVFVSLYFWSQDRSAGGPLGDGHRRPRDVMDGKPLDHPDTLGFLANEYRFNLLKAAEWLQGGRGVVIRYEGLHDDPLAELTGATDQIAPVSADRIAAAVSRCSAANMRATNQTLAGHVRAAVVGESRTRLSDVHLAIFRERHADLIQSLGYEVR